HVLSLARWRFVTEAAPAKGADPVRGLLGRGQDTFGDLGLFGGKEPARLELVIVSPDSAVFLVSPDPTELLPRSAVRVDTELAANCLERDERRAVSLFAHGTCLGFRTGRTSLALDCRLLLGNASPGFRLRNGGLLLSHVSLLFASGFRPGSGRTAALRFQLYSSRLRRSTPNLTII